MSSFDLRRCESKWVSERSLRVFFSGGASSVEGGGGVEVAPVWLNVSGLSAETRYSMRVRAVNALGASEWSARVSVRTARLTRADAVLLPALDSSSLVLDVWRSRLHVAFQQPHRNHNDDHDDHDAFLTALIPICLQLDVALLGGGSGDDDESRFKFARCLPFDPTADTTLRLDAAGAGESSLLLSDGVTRFDAKRVKSLRALVCFDFESMTTNGSTAAALCSPMPASVATLDTSASTLSTAAAAAASHSSNNRESAAASSVRGGGLHLFAFNGDEGGEFGSAGQGIPIALVVGICVCILSLLVLLLSTVVYLFRKRHQHNGKPCTSTGPSSSLSLTLPKGNDDDDDHSDDNESNKNKKQKQKKPLHGDHTEQVITM